MVTPIRKRGNVAFAAALLGLMLAPTGAACSPAKEIIAEDKEPPTITASLSVPANENGWHRTDVTVTFACSDGEAGVASCTSPVTINTNGAGQVVTGKATDIAGNTATTSVPINRDTTRPVIDIISHSEGDTVVTRTFTVSGNVSDTVSGLDAVLCDHTPATISAGTYSCDYTRPNGHYLLLVEAKDLAGNSKFAYVPVNVAAPEVAMESEEREVPAELDLSDLPTDPKAAARELLRRAAKCVEHIPILACGEGVTTQGLLERAIEIDPTLAEAYGHLAKLYSRFGYPETSRAHKANELCQRMVEALPEDPRSYICMARHVVYKDNLPRYMQVDKVEESELWARKAVEVGSDNAKARFLLAGILYQAKFLRHRPGGKPPVSEQDNKDLDEAIAHFREGMRLDPARGHAGSDGMVTEFGNRMLFISGIVAHGQRFSGAAGLLIVLIDGSGGNLRHKGWCTTLSAFMRNIPIRGDDRRLYEYEEFQPAMVKLREHCDNPDVERALALQKEGKTNEAIAAWEPLFDNEMFAQDAYLNLLRLYGKKIHWNGEQEYEGKARALVVKYFERERDPRNRCEAVRETNFRELLPELYDQLQQECGKIGNITGNNAVFD